MRVLRLLRDELDEDSQERLSLEYWYPGEARPARAVEADVLAAEGGRLHDDALAAAVADRKKASTTTEAAPALPKDDGEPKMRKQKGFLYFSALNRSAAWAEVEAEKQRAADSSGGSGDEGEGGGEETDCGEEADHDETADGRLRGHSGASAAGAEWRPRVSTRPRGISAAAG